MTLSRHPILEARILSRLVFSRLRGQLGWKDNQLDLARVAGDVVLRARCENPLSPGRLRAGRRGQGYCLTVERADMTRSRHQFCISGWSVKLVFAVGVA
jgi:hypothetical protein